MLTSYIVSTNGARVRNLLGRVHKCEHTRLPAFWRGDRVKVQCRTCRDILVDGLNFVLRHWSKHHVPICMLFPFVATSFERIPLLCIPITHCCTHISKWVNWRKCVHSDMSILVAFRNRTKVPKGWQKYHFVSIPRQECSGTKCEQSESCLDALDYSSEPCWFDSV